MMSVVAVLESAGLAGVRPGLSHCCFVLPAVRVCDAADLVGNEEGGVVCVWGMAVSGWDSGDIVGRWLAAVQMG
jgi:hypothetical protein